MKSITNCASTGLVTLAKFVSPPYLAVMEWLPVARLDVVYVAIPGVKGTELSRVCPSRKFTDPVGVPDEEDTVAVKVTALVVSTGFSDDWRETVGVAWATFKASAVGLETGK